MNERFNRLMPESEGSLLCFEISKPISLEGYRDNFLARTRDIIATHGEIRLLNVFASSYGGWEESAASLDLEMHVELGQYLKKMAFVNAPDKEIMARLIRQKLTGGEFRFFAADELGQALEWVKT